MMTNGKKIAIALISGAALFLGVAFFAWTIFPYAQMYQFFRNFEKYSSGNTEQLFSSRFAFYPETFVQADMRYQLVDSLLKQYMTGNISSDAPELADFAAAKLAESVARGDNHPEHYLDLGRIYDLLSSLHPEKAAYYRAEAEKQYKQALAIFPGDQSVLYAYMINMSYQGRMDEAIDVARTTLAEDPRVGESHYYLGILLFSKDNSANAGTALTELEFALDKGKNPLPSVTKAIYEKMLEHFYLANDLKTIVVVLKRLKNLNPEQAETYQKVLDYIDTAHQMPILKLN